MIDNLLQNLKKMAATTPKKRSPHTAFEKYESCNSCRSQYKDALGHIKMCCCDQQIVTQTHTNQNGHVRHKSTTSITGHVPCFLKTKGANKCKDYVRNFNRPLQTRG